MAPFVKAAQDEPEMGETAELLNRNKSDPRCGLTAATVAVDGSAAWLLKKSPAQLDGKDRGQAVAGEATVP